MIIYKFGGSSVKDAASISRVREIIAKIQESTPIVVVVSAFGGVTDELIGLASAACKRQPYTERLEALKARHLQTLHELIGAPVPTIDQKVQAALSELDDLLKGISLIGECSPKFMDFAMSFGERLSAFIIAAYFHQVGIPARYVDARQVIKTDSQFGDATVQKEKTEIALTVAFDSAPRVTVMGGFIASNELGETTTLGRGGSDYTASLVGAALDAEEVQIWTDVSGVYSADPRIAPNAMRIDQLSYIEAMEMAHFGAKVIYAPTMQPVRDVHIPLRIKNTFAPNDVGTVVTSLPSAGTSPVRAVTAMKDMALLRLEGSGLAGVPGTSSRLFAALAEAKVNVVFISQASSEHSICFAVQSASVNAAKRAVQTAFAIEIDRGVVEPITAEIDLAIVAAVGQTMCGAKGVASTYFGALADADVNVIAIAQGSSEYNISVVVKESDRERAVRAVHDAFLAPSATTTSPQTVSSTAPTSLFLAGVGGVGGTFLSQLASVESSAVLAGVASSKNMLFGADGLDPANAKAELDLGVELSLQTFLQTAKASLPAVLIDCTSSPDLAKQYESLHAAGVHIVAANKKAFSASQAQFEALTAGEAETKFETTVGAGLPVVSTIQQLIATGDKINKIEAVLSGTLAYLFSTFMSGEESFSSLVQSAQKAGYTEPDPRDDLSGQDVLRKILILARLAGAKLEQHDVQLELPIDRTCLVGDDLETLFAALKEADPIMDRKRVMLRKNNKTMVYMASWDGMQARIGLQSIGMDHPFASLSGTDNMISITTDRYADQPLIIRGPGAGKDVTAAGVLSDVLSIIS